MRNCLASKHEFLKALGSHSVWFLHLMNKTIRHMDVRLYVLLWHSLWSNTGSSCIYSPRLQRGKKHQIENGSGAEDNGDSSHCSNASVHSNQEAGPSIKRTKTSDDSGLDMDNTTENGGGDTALDGASEIELVFRPHPTLMEKEDAAQTRWANTEHGESDLFRVIVGFVLESSQQD